MLYVLYVSCLQSVSATVDKSVRLKTAVQMHKDMDGSEIDNVQNENHVLTSGGIPPAKKRTLPEHTHARSAESTCLQSSVCLQSQCVLRKT